VLSLRRGNLTTVLIIRQYHGDAVSKREIVPRQVKSLAALVRPGRADTCPDLLAILVLTCIPAVVENVGWGVRHRNIVSNNTLQCIWVAGYVNEVC
jgi:hypothetical protein